MQKHAEPPIEQQGERDRQGLGGAIQQAGRVFNFWRRGGAVYFGYKGAQVADSSLQRPAIAQEACSQDAVSSLTNS